MADDGIAGLQRRVVACADETDDDDGAEFSVSIE
jgi:hypothetical protein